jgi:hypothetical protein
VDGWEGSIKAVPDVEPGTDGDDYFELAGPFAIRYGMSVPDEVLSAQLETLRDSDIPVRVTGYLICGAPDVSSTRIDITGIE